MTGSADTEGGPEGRLEPLAGNQLGLWLASRADPGSPAYHVGTATRVSGPLDRRVLEGAVQSLVDHADALRTEFVEVDGTPYRRIRERVEVGVDWQTRRALDGPALLAWGQAEYERPFDLTTAPLIRVAVVPLEAPDPTFGLVIVAHHLAMDGASTLLALRHLHGCVAAGRPEIRRWRGASYQEFVEWQHRWLESEEAEEARSFWSSLLSPAPERLDLPTDRRPARDARLRGEVVEDPLPAGLGDRVSDRARELGTTPFVFTLASFLAFLRRLTGQDDLVVGTPMHGRPSSRFRMSVGHFVNAVPVREGVPADLPFADLVRRLHASVREASHHQHLPLPRILEAAGIRASGPPFRAFFLLRRVGSRRGKGSEIRIGTRSLSIPGADLELEVLPVHEGAGQFPLTLELAPTEDSFDALWKFDTARLDPATVRSWARAFRTLLQSFADDPEAPVEGPALVDGEEPGSTVQGPEPGWEPATVLDLLRDAPEGPGPGRVEDPAGGATVPELLDRARALAAHLSSAGVEPGDRVGLCLGRSADYLVALLAVWRLRAAFVPLDPDFPLPRLELMLHDAGVRVAVADREGRRVLEPMEGEPLSLVDPEEVRAGAGELDLPGPGPDDLAYVIFTSGSTGRPKGVAISHGALANFLRAMEVRPGLQGGDVLVAVTTWSFDISILELLLPPLVGARLVIASREEASDGRRLAARLEEVGATVLQATPATWRMLLDAGWRPKPGFRALCGGETLTRELADRLLEAGCRVWNLYGPTEATVWATAEPVSAGTAPPSLGAPLHGVSLHVRDPGGRPVPRGVPGELWIGGEGVAEGYWGRPEETEAHFRTTETGEREYRTGDGVRMTADGRLQFRGRLDTQLKIRGFRIEAGEVESVLARHPEVRVAAVGALGDDPGSTALHAWIEPRRAGEPPEAGELAELAAGHLPPYMIPTSWSFVEEMPLTSSGKLDRRALAARGRGADPGPASVPPRSPEERALAEIWEEVLERPGIGVFDDFFALGGHSILATRVVARVRDRLGVELPLADLFDVSTVAGLTRRIEERRSRDALPPIEPAHDPPGTPLPLSFSQERMWFMQEVAPGSTAYNVGQGLLLRGSVEPRELADAFRVVARRHQVLRSSYPAEGGKPRQVVRDDREPRIRLGRRGTTGGAEEAAAEIQRFLDRPYDLERDPLARLVVIPLEPGVLAVGVGTHHIVSDALSIGLMIQEVVKILEDGPDALPPLPLQYSDFSRWQREHLSEGRLDAQLEYWLDRVRGAPPLDLPTDHPRPRFFTFEGDHVQLPLPPGLRDRVRSFSGEVGATPFMVFLAAFDVLLQTYARQDDIAVGVPVAHRNVRELEELVGTFVNTLVLRTDLSGASSFREVLDRVRTDSVAAFARQDLPFELLVRRAQVDRDPARPPLVQVLFNLVQLEWTPPSDGRVQGEILPLEGGATQFELGLSVFLGAEESRLTLSYSTDLFRRETVERMVAHYLEILDRALAEPHLPPARLRRLPDPERERVLELARGEAPDAEHPWIAVPSRVAAVARKTPDAVAVRGEDGTLAYAELVERARRISGALAEAGVGPGDRVGILMERGAGMVAALLGILGSGGAYVPLDPTYPEARLEYMLDHSGAVALVTHRGLHRGLEVPAHVLELDAGPLPPPGDWGEPDPEDPAYVIYTSGSTGRPKGVQVPHRALANFLHSMAHVPGCEASDVLAAVTTISFDISILELFLPLTVGARVVVVDEGVSVDGARLARLLDEAGVTLMQATPATWKLLLAAGWTGRPGMRALCGGEALPPDLAEELLPRVSELWNMYGPTETTIWSTVERIAPGDPITIGRPIANTRTYILDETLEPLPPGVPGELYIGGRGVALGYLDQPDLTAERFVPSPFVEGDRLYGTGDLARLRSDGRLEHLGRLDHQVKVRGFRIELGEVESVLKARDDVEDAAVVARSDRLLAYLVPTDRPGPTVGELRAWIGDRLPSYMMPSRFTTLGALPLTPNGKVDRKALPEPGGTPGSGTEFVPPEGRLETLIADTWASLLEVDRVGAHDNFFELGGHSLLAMEAVATIRKKARRELDPRMLFFKTVRELADWMTGNPSGAR